MRVDLATMEDFKSWLVLAAEVEDMFGPMVGEPGFHNALVKCIKRGGAYCVRENDGPPGTRLIGGLMFTGEQPEYILGWLVVTEKWRRHGNARLMVEKAFKKVQAPARVLVTTFRDDEPHGAPAIAFYKSLGFETTEIDVRGPGGEVRQTLVKRFG